MCVGAISYYISAGAKQINNVNYNNPQREAFRDYDLIFIGNILFMYDVIYI